MGGPNLRRVGGGSIVALARASDAQEDAASIGESGVGGIGVEVPPLCSTDGGLMPMSTTASNSQADAAGMDEIDVSVDAVCNGDDAPLDSPREPITTSDVVGDAAWQKAQPRTIEDLRQELEVERGRELKVVATQTDWNSWEVLQECAERWFTGFSDPMVAMPPFTGRTVDDVGGTTGGQSVVAAATEGTSPRREGQPSAFCPGSDGQISRFTAEGAFKAGLAAGAAIAGPPATGGGFAAAIGRLATASGGLAHAGGPGTSRSCSMSSTSSSASSSTASSARRQRVASSEDEGPASAFKHGVQAAALLAGELRIEGATDQSRASADAAAAAADASTPLVHMPPKAAKLLAVGHRPGSMGYADLF